MTDNARSLTEEVVKGCVLGFGAVTCATPFLNWNNHRSAGMPFVTMDSLANPSIRARFVQQVFAGWPAYTIAVVPSATIAVTADAIIHRLFHLNPKSETATQKLACASAAGAISGAVTAIPEGIAQAQQLKYRGQGFIQVLQMLWQLQGPMALTRGTGAVMAREGLYVAGYLALMPLLVAKLQPITGNKSRAELSAALLAGGTVGFVTTPLHCTFRYQKQASIYEETPNKSYGAIAKEVYKASGGQARNISSAFFKNAVPRSVTTVVATLAMHKGKECYESFREARPTP
jgi:hypothetical protein